MKKKKRRLILIITAIAIILYFIVTLINYTYNFISLKKEENDLKTELAELQQEKTDLKMEIQKLNDPEYVVRYAKEKYLYSEEGEYVIKIPNENNIEVEELKEDTKLYYIPIIALILIIIKKHI